MVSVIIGQFIVWNHVECDWGLFSNASQQSPAVDLQQDSRHHCAGPTGSSVGTSGSAAGASLDGLGGNATSSGSWSRCSG